ncbi:unnamed protein product, partial [Polarella glacialis]
LRTVPPHSLLHRRGPCDLRPLPGTDNVACEGPRWALGSGESCQVRCSWGRFPNGVRGSSSLLQCYEGQLSQPDFSCQELQCQAPQVLNAAPGRSCLEGTTVRHGQNCTPSCVEGFEPKSWGFLGCKNGTLMGSFACEARESCAAPAEGSIVHASFPACSRGSVIPHGGNCVPLCEAGYQASTDLTCRDGLMQPQVFSCIVRPTTTTIPEVFVGQVVAANTASRSASPSYAAADSFPGSGAAPAVEPEEQAFRGDLGKWLPFLALTVLIGSVVLCCCLQGSGSAKGKGRSMGLCAGGQQSSRRGADERHGSTDSGSGSDEELGSRKAHPAAQQTAPSQEAQREAVRPLLQAHSLPREASPRSESGSSGSSSSSSRRSEERLPEQFGPGHHSQMGQQHLRQQEQFRQQQLQQRQPHERESQTRLPTSSAHNERILGSSFRASPPPRAQPQSSPPEAHKYHKDKDNPRDWMDVRAGHEASHIPWSDVRINE